MGSTDERARWRLTDTLSVPVTVLHVAEAEGRARVTSVTGEKWVRLEELEYEETTS